MNKAPKSMTRDEWVALILGGGLFLGIILRLVPGLMAGFPLNDGGMFLSMIRDLHDSHYLLPHTTSYNLFDIPFAYPPLGFYIARILADLSGAAEISLLRWLPVSFNVLSIVVFFFLSNSILQDKARAALSTAFLAVTPGGYIWHIMGGGLTRSLGALFLLTSVFFLKKLFEEGSWKILLITTLACTLAVLSHPEIILHTAGSCALVWLFFGRTRRGLLQAASVAFGTFLLSAPWWLTILLRFGFDPFLSTLHTGMYNNATLTTLASMVFARLGFFPVLLVLRIAGIVWSALKREHLFLLAWTMVPVFVEPRSSGAIIFYPLSMLAAIGFADAVPALINWVRAKKSLPVPIDFTKSRIMNFLLITMLIYMFVDNFATNYGLVETSLKPPVIIAFDWTRENTSKQSQFVILSGGGVMTDPVQEWFPALTGRHSQTTLQGLEWTLGPDFFVHYKQLVDLQHCERLACIEAWSKDTNLDYSYLLLNLDTIQTGLFEEMQINRGYELAYQNPSIAIFRRRNK